MHKIIVLDEYVNRTLSAGQRDMIERAAAGEYRVMAVADVSHKQYADVEIAFGFFSREQTNLMPNLVWQQLPSAGAESFLRNGEGRARFFLTNATGAFGVSIAEHILALMLSINRGLHHYRNNQMAREWKDAPLKKLLADSSVLIVGLGDIGLETAKRLKALGMRVMAIKRTTMVKPACVDELCFDLDESLDRMLTQADYVVLCLPNTNDTRHVLDKRRLSLLKDGSAVINIGRGSLIDQDALTDELRTGRISAGLDVTVPEPLPPENPLWALPECLITPHMSGRSDRSMGIIAGIFADNLSRFKEGRTLYNLVDLDEGY